MNTFKMFSIWPVLPGNSLFVDSHVEDYINFVVKLVFHESMWNRYFEDEMISTCPTMHLPHIILVNQDKNLITLL